MKTIINYTPANGSYSQIIDNLDYACTAQDYIDGCRMNGDGDYWDGCIRAHVIASVYEDDADPMFDDPNEISDAIIAIIAEEE